MSKISSLTEKHQHDKSSAAAAHGRSAILWTRRIMGLSTFHYFFLSCLLSILLWKSIKFRLWGCQTLHLLALLGGFLLKIQNAFSVIPLAFSSLGQHWLYNDSALEFSVYTIGWSSVRSSIVLLNILHCWLIGVFYLSLQILVVDQNSQTTCEEN